MSDKSDFETGFHLPVNVSANYHQQRLAELDLSSITADVQPFLMDPAGAQLLTRENVDRLLQA